MVSKMHKGSSSWAGKFEGILICNDSRVHVLKFRFSYRRVQTYSHLACVWRLKVVIKLVKLVLCWIVWCFIQATFGGIPWSRKYPSPKILFIVARYIQWNAKFSYFCNKILSLFSFCLSKMICAVLDVWLCKLLLHGVISDKFLSRDSIYA